MNEIFDIVVIGFAFLLLARDSSTKLGSPLAPSSVGFAFLLLARHNPCELGILLLLRSSVIVVFRVLFAFLGAWWHGDERNDFRRDR